MSAPHWEWTPEEVRRAGHRVADLIADHLAGLRDRPVFRPVPQELVRAFQDEPAPAHATAVDALFDDVADRVAAYPFGNGHPRFAGWVNSPPAIIGAFAIRCRTRMVGTLAPRSTSDTMLLLTPARWARAWREIPRWVRSARIRAPRTVMSGSAAVVTAATIGEVRSQWRMDWKPARPARRLRLISSQPFETGVLHLGYGPDPNPPTGTYQEAKESLPQE